MDSNGGFNILKVIKFIRHLPNFGKLVYRLFKDSRVGFSAKLYVWSGLGYFILPFDLFPDFLVPGLGYGEDLLVCYMLFRAFIKSCPQEVVWEHIREIEKENV